MTTVAKSTSVARSHTVADLAERWQCKPHVVLALIDAGELLAIDVSSPGSKRPRWRILPEHLEAFELRRRAKPAEPAPMRRKGKERQESLIDPATGKVRREFRGTIGAVG